MDIALRTVGRTRYAQIARYDRVWDERGEVRRLHQEDFCQALGYGHEKKYQEHGGPSFAQCYRLVQEASSEPAIDAQHLLRWQIFNVLAGNSDPCQESRPVAPDRRYEPPPDPARTLLMTWCAPVPSNASTITSPSMSAESAIPAWSHPPAGRRSPSNAMCGRNSWAIWYRRPRPLCRKG